MIDSGVILVVVRRLRVYTKALGVYQLLRLGIVSTIDLRANYGDVIYNDLLPRRSRLLTPRFRVEVINSNTYGVSLYIKVYYGTRTMRPTTYRPNM